MFENQEARDIIKQVTHRYFALHEQTIDLLASIAKTTKLDKGQSLLQLGKIARHMHILKKGVIVSYFSNDGNLYHKNIFLEGDFVGSMVSSLKNEPSQFGLKSIEESRLISLSYTKFKTLTLDNPDLMKFYLAYLEKNWVIDKEKREIDIVMKEASQRYHEFTQKHPNIEDRVPLKYIASHLGITQTQLSRIRKNRSK